MEVFTVGGSRWAGDIGINGRAEKVLEGRATAGGLSEHPSHEQ